MVDTSRPDSGIVDRRVKIDISDSAAPAFLVIVETDIELELKLDEKPGEAQWIT